MLMVVATGPVARNAAGRLRIAHQCQAKARAGNTTAPKSPRARRIDIDTGREQLSRRLGCLAQTETQVPGRRATRYQSARSGADRDELLSQSLFRNTSAASHLMMRAARYDGAAPSLNRRSPDEMRLTWEEYLAAEPCRGCAGPMRDAALWPAIWTVRIFFQS
jgi:hypothetical protein